MDWQALADRLDLLVPYWRERLVNECVRCFRRPGTVTGSWFGNYHEQSVDEPLLRWYPWSMLLNGYNSAWWYTEFRGVQFGAVATALAPDFRPTAGFRAAVEEIAAIRNGPATLLPALQRANDGIAVLYSRPSLHLWGNCADEVLEALEDIGLQFDMIAPDQLAADALSRAGFRLLVLPGTCVLADNEIAAVRQFASAGGSVLAVLPPAVFDRHGRVREAPALADLFGIRGGSATLADRLVKVTAPGQAPFDAWQVADGVAATAATVLASFEDGQPAATVRRHGGGAAACLTFSLEGYEDARTLWQSEEPMRDFLATVLEKLGVAPAFRLVGRGPRRGLEIVRFSDGPHTYVCASREPLGDQRTRTNAACDLQLAFAGKAATYDVRGNRRLGHLDTVPLDLVPGETRLYARLATSPPPLTAEVRPTRVESGQAIVVTVTASGNMRRAVRLTVDGPDGRTVPHWSHTLLMADGTAATVLPIALNAAEGERTVRLRDTVTGQQSSARFEVRGR